MHLRLALRVMLLDPKVLILQIPSAPSPHRFFYSSESQLLESGPGFETCRRARGGFERDDYYFYLQAAARDRSHCRYRESVYIEPGRPPLFSFLRLGAWFLAFWDLGMRVIDSPVSSPSQLFFFFFFLPLCCMPIHQSRTIPQLARLGLGYIL